MQAQRTEDRQRSALENFDRLPDSANLRLPVVSALFAVGPATIWRWSAAGRIPAPHKLGQRVTVWNAGEIRRCLRERR